MGKGWFWGVLCFWGQFVYATETLLIFKQESSVPQQFTLSQLQQRISSLETTVAEPHIDNKLQRYHGFRFNLLLDTVFGEHWRDGEELVFHCLDGFQAMIPVRQFRQYDSVLAYAMPDHQDFKLTGDFVYKKEIDLAPFYLVWETEKYPKQAHLFEINSWPYQVISIELVGHTEHSRTYPPAPRTEAVLRGFENVRKYCLPCHSLNGEGGGKAPELNYPINVTEYFREEWLKQWIDNPAKLRWNAKMPPLSPHLPERTQLIEDIIKYLKAMQHNKQKPS